LYQIVYFIEGESIPRDNKGSRISLFSKNIVYYILHRGSSIIVYENKSHIKVLSSIDKGVDNKLS
jgi:hypothetical protein